jgi:hypothetical protein
VHNLSHAYVGAHESIHTNRQPAMSGYETVILLRRPRKGGGNIPNNWHILGSATSKALFGSLQFLSVFKNMTFEN